MQSGKGSGREIGLRQKPKELGAENEITWLLSVRLALHLFFHEIEIIPL